MMNLAVKHLNFLFIRSPASLPIKIGPSAHQKYDPRERKHFYDSVSLFQWWINENEAFYCLRCFSDSKLFWFSFNSPLVVIIKWWIVKMFYHFTKGEGIKRSFTDFSSPIALWRCFYVFWIKSEENFMCSGWINQKTSETRASDMIKLLIALSGATRWQLPPENLLLITVDSELLAAFFRDVRYRDSIKFVNWLKMILWRSFNRCIVYEFIGKLW